VYVCVYLHACVWLGGSVCVHACFLWWVPLRDAGQCAASFVGWGKEHAGGCMLPVRAGLQQTQACGRGRSRGMRVTVSEDNNVERQQHPLHSACAPHTLHLPPPPVPAAHRVIVLEDNDVLHLTGGGYGIYNTSQQVRFHPRVLRRLRLPGAAG